MPKLDRGYTLGEFPIPLERDYVLGRFGDRTAAKDDDDEAVSAQRLADLLILYTGYRILGLALEAEQLQETKAKDHFRKGTQLARRFFKQFAQGFDNYLESPSETLRLKTKFKMAVRNKSFLKGAPARVRYLDILLPRMSARMPLLRSTFAGRASLAIMRMARLDLKAEDLATRAINLKNLAAIPPVSGLQMGRKWLMEAARIAGVEPSEMEDTVADAAVARDLSVRIREIDNELAGSRKGTKKAKELEAERATLQETLDLAVASSSDPQTTKAAAVVEQTERLAGNATPQGQKVQLSPDQEAAMVARGKVVVAAGAGSGKCVRTDTLIQTNGGLIEIGSLCEGMDKDSDQFCVKRIHGPKGPEDTSHVYYNGFSATLILRTSAGFELEATPNHRVFAIRDGAIVWVRLDELTVDDYVAIDRRPGLFASDPFVRKDVEFQRGGFQGTQGGGENIPAMLTPQVARLLGYLISEGYVRQDQWSFSFSTSDPEQAELYRDSMRDLFDWQEHFDEGRSETQEVQVVCEVCRREIVETLMAFGLRRVGAHEKEIPFGILRSPKPIVRDFLRALWDGDGGVENNVLSYCTVSDKLARQLHVLMLSFGVVGRLRPKKTSSGHAWVLTVSGEAVPVFVEEIGFNLTHKQEAALALADRESNTNVDVVPTVAQKCDAVFQAYKSATGMALVDHPSYGAFKDYRKGRRRPSHDALLRFLHVYSLPEDPNWQSLHGLVREWFYDPVIAIEDSVSYTADFVVPQSQAFSGGGFINHNTRVLAAKVAYHMEQGLGPQNIIACSFTRKSAAELKERIKKYGGDLTGNVTAEAGFGTTHYVAGVLVLGQYGGNRQRPDGKSIEGWVQNDLLRLAVEQVKMSPEGEPPPFDPEESFFPKMLPEREKDLATPEPPEGAPPPVDVGDPFEMAIRDALTYHERIPRRQLRNTGWLDWTINFLEDILRRGADPTRLSPKQRASVEKALNRAKVEYEFPTRTAGFDKSAVNTQKQIKKLREKYPIWSNRPANMWFNIGATDRDFQDGEAPIALGQLGLYVSNNKGRLIAPGKAYGTAQAAPKDLAEDFEQEMEGEPQVNTRTLAAVYGGYEWLKNNEEEFKGALDMDDVLISASRLLIEDPRALAQLQDRIKCLLIDEAQDLNAAQHLLFGLIAGYVDPATQAPRKDGQMTADTFAFIGDDRQAIYAFRGALPDLFIEKSDLVEGGEGFNTKTLDLNYRSGSAIVEAANNLIKHNEKQIPMVCKANVERKGTGAIQQVTLKTLEDCAVYAAEQIKAATQELEDVKDPVTQAASPSDFGVAVRTNKEAYQYGIEMIKRGIPFKSKYNFFKGPAVKALLNLMTLASTGKKDVRRINRAVVEGVRAPDWGLSEKTLKTRLTEKAGRGADWFDWLSKGGWKEIYRDREMQERLHKYVGFLKEVFDLKETDSDGVLNFLTNYPGPEGNLIDALVERVKQSKDDMEDFGKQYEDTSEENLREYASAPIQVLFEITKTYPKLDDAVAYLNELYEMNERLSSTDDPTRKDYKEDLEAVQIDTVHGWKGLECKNLFVPMWEGRRGGFPHGKAEDMTSERRLAYVAITRGEDSVTILRPEFDGAVDREGRPIPTRQSRFVTEACIQDVPAYGESVVVEDPEEQGRTAQEKEAKFRFTDDELDAYLNDDLEYLEGLRSDEEPERRLEAEWKFLP